MSFTKDQIIDAVSAMSVMEITDLINEMEVKFGVSSASSSTTVLDTSSSDNIEEKVEFDLILKSTGSNKVAVIKAVRSITGLGLKEAKDLVESAPALLKGGLNKDNAENFKKSLEEAGAEVELK